MIRALESARKSTDALNLLERSEYFYRLSKHNLRKLTEAELNDMRQYYISLILRNNTSSQTVPTLANVFTSANQKHEQMVIDIELELNRRKYLRKYTYNGIRKFSNRELKEMKEFYQFLIKRNKEHMKGSEDLSEKLIRQNKSYQRVLDRIELEIKRRNVLKKPVAKNERKFSQQFGKAEEEDILIVLNYMKSNNLSLTAAINKASTDGKLQGLWCAYTSDLKSVDDNRKPMHNIILRLMKADQDGAYSEYRSLI